ncbi:MAG: PhzF family phenazine biosynthesis protein [Clostridiales bacterium]|nr:PhzF family phenazine biosynthesis protein [Clostridiales bacterium]
MVDAFTDRSFGGNAASAVKGASVPDARGMQLLARRLNLSERAFILSRRCGDPWLQAWGGAPPSLLSFCATTSPGP